MTRLSIEHGSPVSIGYWQAIRDAARILSCGISAAALYALLMHRAPSAPVIIEVPRASVRPAAACGGHVEAGGIIVPRTRWRT